jgi:hypothetical protein
VHGVRSAAPLRLRLVDLAPGRSLLGVEQVVVGLGLPAHALELLQQVLLGREHDPAAERDYPRLLALAGHGQLLSAEVEVEVANAERYGF